MAEIFCAYPVNIITASNCRSMSARLVVAWWHRSGLGLGHPPGHRYCRYCRYNRYYIYHGAAQCDQWASWWHSWVWWCVSLEKIQIILKLRTKMEYLDISNISNTCSNKSRQKSADSRHRSVRDRGCLIQDPGSYHGTTFTPLHPDTKITGVSSCD